MTALDFLQVLEYIKFRCGDLGNVAARKSEAPEKKPEPAPKKRPAVVAEHLSMTGEGSSKVGSLFLQIIFRQ